MDYGLIGGLAEGIKEGVRSYSETKRAADARKMAEEEALDRRKMQQLQTKQAGFDYNPEAGFVPSAESLQKKQAEMVNQRNRELIEGAERGLIFDRDESGLIKNYRQNDQFKKPVDQKQAAEIRKIEAETANLKKQGDIGKMLPADKILLVQQGEQIPSQLADIKKTLESNEDLFGPVRGRLGSMNPYDERAQTINSQVKTAAQSFGRYMEGGVLRKEDEAKYEKMFPQLSDPPKIAANKLALIDRMLKSKQAGEVEALKVAGYDVNAFGRGGRNIPAAPGILSQGGQGLIPEAVASGGDNQDAQALDWATKNKASTDPKKREQAAQILKKLGVQ